MSLDEFYREPGDVPGSGKIRLRVLLESLPSHVKYIKLDASGGTNEVNLRSKWTKWFVKDKRTFGTWNFAQINHWLVEHHVSPEFTQFVMNQKLSGARRWLRILSTNESLIKYYKKIGFSTVNKYLSPTVKMKGSVQKIIAQCK